MSTLQYTSTGWRLWTIPSYVPNYDSSSAWDVYLIEFFPNTDCTGTPLSGGDIHTSRSSVYLDISGSGPQNAFLTNGKKWSGRVDENQEFYIGKTFSNSYEIGCAKINQVNQNYANKVYVQKLNGNVWENVYVGSNLPYSTGIIINYEA